MDWKKIGKALLFSYIAIMITLIPVAAVFLVFSMVYIGTNTIPSYISYVLAAYTFTTFTFAIINTVKYRKYNSPVLSAGKAASLAAGAVSILTLESTMLTTFNGGSMDLTSRRIMLGCTGAAVSIFIIVMAIYMIVQSSKKLSLAMSDFGKILGDNQLISMLAGILIGIAGLVLVSLAYPVYNRAIKTERERIAPEIIRLTDELMK